MTTGASNRTIRVLIADDQRLFAESLQYVIGSKAPDIEILDVAENGLVAIRRAEELTPDLILMDVRMPKLDGVEATREIRRTNPRIRIVMLSTFQDDEYVRTALGYGAVGYLLKTIAPDEVIRAIRAVDSGIMQISPAVAKALATGSPVDEGGIEDELLIEPLTRRERDVLALIARSYDNHQIADFLNVTGQTAKNYVHNLYGKLGVTGRLQLLQLLQQPRIRMKLGLSDE